MLRDRRAALHVGCPPAGVVETEGMKRTTTTLDALRSTFGERLVTPHDAKFDEAAEIVFAGERRCPALIARPVSDREVSAAIAFARDANLPIAVRAGGHDFARGSVVDGGVVIDLRSMSAVSIDVERRIATASGAITAGEYVDAAHVHGLGTGLGDVPAVGVTGITLGGGIGYLSRRDGLTIDNLVGADVVLADGSVVHADEHEHTDLFWALRGGGGRFGVVTRLQLRLREVGTIVGGLLALPGEPDVVANVLAAAIAAPDELGTMVNVMKAPPAPFLPAEIHGRPMTGVFLCYAGRLEDAEHAIAPLRAIARPLADLVKPQPYPGLYALAPDLSGMFAHLRTGFDDALDATWAAEAVDAVAAAPSSVAIVSLRPMGAAIARVPVDATAFAHREHAVMTTVSALDKDPDVAMRARSWADETATRLAIGGGAYVNFLSEITEAELQRAYPEPTRTRLAAVARRYDPDGLFARIGSHSRLAL